MIAKEITITNVGPVESLRLKVPVSGGLVVLKARNGRGKTKSLEAIESAVNGRGKVEVRDGALSGSVEAFGVNIKVGRKTTRSGELSVTSLEGRLDVATLVDPQVKDPGAADARRIKALIQLSGVKPSPELFYELAGGREALEQFASPTTLESDDLVLMAERLKRELESAARKEEDRAEHAEGRARGARESAAGVDVSGECDREKLQAALEQAIRHESELRTQRESAHKAERAAKLAKDKLEDAELSYSGKSAEDLRAEESRWTQQVETDTAKVRAAEEALRLATQKAAETRAELAHTIAARKQAESHEASIAALKQQLAESIPTAPTDEAIQAAAEQLAKAREAVEQAGIVRRAKEQLATAEKHAGEAQSHRQQSAKLRNAAKATDEVLSEAVQRSGTALRVEAGRLVLNTKRGATYYGELSHGERWKLALDIAIEAVGERGVLTIPQEAYESLDPTNRRMIAEHVVGRGVVILTAEASDDEEITAEVVT
jgi:hypothetical protein